MKKKRPRTYQNRVARARNINMGKRGGEIRKVESSQLKNSFLNFNLIIGSNLYLVWENYMTIYTVDNLIIIDHFKF